MPLAASWPHCPPVESRHLTPHTSRRGPWKPRIAPGFGRDSGSQEMPMAVRVWDAGRSECRAVTVRIRG